MRKSERVAEVFQKFETNLIHIFFDEKLGNGDEVFVLLFFCFGIINNFNYGESIDLYFGI